MSPASVISSGARPSIWCSTTAAPAPLTVSRATMAVTMTSASSFVTSPPGLPDEQVTALLASCDRGSTTGCRDFAILTLLVRLGLRAGEVAALALSDIHWRQGDEDQRTTPALDEQNVQLPARQRVERSCELARTGSADGHDCDGTASVKLL